MPWPDLLESSLRPHQWVWRFAQEGARVELSCTTFGLCLRACLARSNDHNPRWRVLL